MEGKCPMNYGLLAVVTLISGVWWGLIGHAFFPADFQIIHFQLLACICVATIVATALMKVPFCAGLRFWRGEVAVPLFLGWVVGAVAEVLVTMHLGTSLWSGPVAAFTALVLFVLLLLLAGSLLEECNPDSFMKVVLTMDT